MTTPHLALEVAEAGLWCNSCSRHSGAALAFLTSDGAARALRCVDCGSDDIEEGA